MGRPAFNLVALVTGTFIAGEALALLVGMHGLSRGNNAWVSSKNDLFLALEVVAGLGLLYMALAGRRADSPYALVLLAGLALLTHGYRGWECVATGSDAPLVVVNNGKLAGLLAIFALGRVQGSRAGLSRSLNCVRKTGPTQVMDRYRDKAANPVDSAEFGCRTRESGRSTRFGSVV